MECFNLLSWADSEKYFNLVFIRPYTRFGTYLVGLSLGYIVWRLRDRQAKKEVGALEVKKKYLLDGQINGGSTLLAGITKEAETFIMDNLDCFLFVRFVRYLFRRQRPSVKSVDCRFLLIGG